MQFASINSGLKPIVLSTVLGSTMFGFAYNDIDMSSYVKTEIVNQETSNHLLSVESNTYSGIALKQFFEELYQKWQQKTMFYSFSHQITDDENYKKIVAMGKKATPFIIEKLKEGPSLIVWALNDIYGRKISNNPKITIEQACKLWVKSLT